MNIPVDEIQLVNFVETPTKQSSHGQLHKFDIIYDFPKKEGIDHKRYCILLLRILFVLRKKERIPFLNYQCKLVKNKFRWLNSVYLLLEYNYRIFIRDDYAKPFSEVIDLVEEQRNLYPRIHSVETKMDEVAEDKIMKKVRWYGTVSQLVNMYYQTMCKTYKGNQLINLSPGEMIEMIMERYCKSDGSPFSEATIRTYLKPSKVDKHPNLDLQIKIPDEKD